MKRLLSPKNDYVFKRIMVSDPTILPDLLNSVMRLPPGSRIRYAEILNPQILPEDIQGKLIILDIHAVDDKGRHYNIEMQVRRYTEYPNRALFYLCKLYTEQLGAGEQYHQLRPAIAVHFLDFDLFPDESKYFHRFGIKDLDGGDRVLSENIQLNIIELRKFEMFAQPQPGDPLREWLRFLNHAHEEVNEMERTYTNPAIHKAFNVLDRLSADEEAKQLAQLREKAMRDEAMFIEEARREAREEGKKEGRDEGLKEGDKQRSMKVARELLRRGMTKSNEIAEISGLEIGEVTALIRESAKGN